MVIFLDNFLYHDAKNMFSKLSLHDLNSNKRICTNMCTVVQIYNAVTLTNMMRCFMSLQIKY